MLLILQILLFACFCVTLVQAFFDFIKGMYLIITGLVLLAVGYLLKLIAVLLRKGRRHRRLRPASRVRWKVISA